MKFHFGSHHHHGHDRGGGCSGGGVVVPTDHPSALLVIDAHSPVSCRDEVGDHHHPFGTDPRGPAELYGAEYIEHHQRADADGSLNVSRHLGGFSHRSSPSSPGTMGGMSFFFHKSSVASRYFGSPTSTSSGGDDAGIVTGLVTGCIGGNAGVFEAAGGGSSPTKNGSPTSKRALHLDHHESECPISNPDPHSRPRSRQFFRLGRHRSKGIDCKIRHRSNSIAGCTDRAVSPCCGLTSDSSDDEDELGGSERTMRTRKAAVRRGRREEDELGGTEHTRHSRRGIARLRAARTNDHDELGGSEHAPRTTARRPRRGIAGLRKPRLRRSQSLPIEEPTAVVKTILNQTASLPAAVQSPTIESMCSFDAMGYGSPADVAVTTSPPPYDETWSQSLPVLADATSPPYDETLTQSLPVIPSCRHVTFTSVQVREYSTILGDHPCCPSGPPLALGWELERENFTDFEQYEKEREPLRAKNKDDIRLCGEVRRRIIRSLVVTASNAAISPSPVDCSPGVERNNADEKSDNNRPLDVGAEKNAPAAAGRATALYSARELRQAERRLSRDRAGLNSRAERRMTNKFFRTLTPGEEGGEVGCGVVVASAAVATAESGEKAKACAEVNEYESTSPRQELVVSPRSIGSIEDTDASTTEISHMKPSATVAEFNRSVH